MEFGASECRRMSVICSEFRGIPIPMTAPNMKENWCVHICKVNAAWVFCWHFYRIPNAFSHTHTHSHDPTWATHVISSSGVQSMCYKDLNYINGIPCVTCALCTITLKIIITCICQKLPVWPKWNGQLFGLAYIVLWHTFACPNSCSMTSVTGKHTHTHSHTYACAAIWSVCLCISLHHIYTQLCLIRLLLSPYCIWMSAENNFFLLS